MSKQSRLIYALLFLLLCIVYTYRWLQPVSLPEGKVIKPAIMAIQPSISTQKWYTLLLKNNLWDPERGEIIVKNSQKSTIARAAEVDKRVQQKTKWSLKGVVQTINGELIAIINTAGKQPKPYRQGEQLPNGELLEKIMPDGIEISDGGKQRIFLFGKQSTALKHNYLDPGHVPIDNVKN